MERNKGAAPLGPRGSPKTTPDQCGRTGGRNGERIGATEPMLDPKRGIRAGECGPDDGGSAYQFAASDRQTCLANWPW
jgi:hypothetical protein